jgi:hypothetical protein
MVLPEVMWFGTPNLFLHDEHLAMAFRHSIQVFINLDIQVYQYKASSNKDAQKTPQHDLCSMTDDCTLIL